jgi:DNA-binding NarL/FixJ family response regulator
MGRGDDFRVVGEAVNGREAIEAADKYCPDVILMDVQMPEMNGLEAARAILVRHPDASIVLVSMSANPNYARIVRDLGAVAFISKKTLTLELFREALEGTA